ncbi:sigma 54-interacting transcriptional regulator [Solibacillus sp. FSL K6-4121]|uniref:sigma 54-interacting transcriptional regulator n=1 Tax=Solibacillus sp. FSL K6-4121 TaxID=2921505 RepID=UPI0030F987BE
MNYKMIMTAGYPEMAEVINEIATELKLNITIVEGILEEAALEVKKLVSQGGYEVVISRAGTAACLQDIVDLPIVYSDSDHFDLLLSFLEAKKMGNKVCFITYPEEGFLFDFNKINEVMGFDVMLYPYKTNEELVKQVKRAKEDGVDVIVGGGVRTANLATNYGIKSMYIKANKRTIKRALVLANQVAKDRMVIKEKVKQLNAVINVSEEGILFVNTNHVVEACNPAAEKLFNISADNVIGKRVDEINSISLKNIFTESIKFEEVGNLTRGKINVSYSPVIVEEVRIGTFINCRDISSIQKLEHKIRRDLYTKGLVAKFNFEDIIHSDAKMTEVVNLAKEYAKTDSTVLIIGESGTGKELFAQSIHNYSERANGPFVAVNCAALPENLLESELFGYVEGAFTGAMKGGRQGVFELAHQGTIFLDEIGEIPLHIQTRLLRVLQEKEVMRLGAEHVIPINIRVVAATNKKLWELVEEGKFRLDLYFRLSILYLEIPPLYQRPNDIPLLINRFLKASEEKLTYEQMPQAIQTFLRKYQWPGNIRQLENIIERYLLYAKNMKSEQLFIEDIKYEMGSKAILEVGKEELLVHKGTLEEINRQVILKMLEENNDNKSVVADLLGISRTTLWKKVSENLER